MSVRAQRAATALAAASAAVLLSCCGKANPTLAPSASAPAATVTATGAQPSPTTSAPRPSAEAPLTQAQANAYGDAVNLRPADVPGFVAGARTSGGGLAAEKQLEEQLARCAGKTVSASTGPQEVSSPQFRRRGALLGDSVSSTASFLSSAAEGAAELQTLRGAHLRGCLMSFLKGLLGGRQFGGATLGGVSIVQGTPPAPGTTGGFGWRVTAVFTLHGVHIPFYLDTLGFIDGRAEVTLQTSAAALPFPATDEERLYELLLERARHNTLP